MKLTFNVRLNGIGSPLPSLQGFVESVRVVWPPANGTVFPIRDNDGNVIGDWSANENGSVTIPAALAAKIGIFLDDLSDDHDEICGVDVVLLFAEWETYTK